MKVFAAEKEKMLVTLSHNVSKVLFFRVNNTQGCVTVPSQRLSQYRPQEFYFNKLGRSPHIKALCHLVSEKKNFEIFLLCSYYSNLGPVLTPRVLFKHLVEVHLDTNIKAQRFPVSDKKNSELFHLCFYITKVHFFIAMFKLITLGPGQYCLQGYHMNKLSRGPLGDATY